MNSRRNAILSNIILIQIMAILYVYFNYKNFNTILVFSKRNSFEVNEDIIDFEGFDNVNGSNKSIIPNIIHLIYLQQPYITFYQLVNIFSIYYNHKPDYIFFHCDDCNFNGKHFNKLKEFQSIWKIIKIFKIPYKTTIFGQDYGWINHHRSDVWRLQLLMNYGGIFLDNDVYVVNSLTKYLNYEMVVSWDDPLEENGLGVQVLIAHKNARLLKSHFDSYRYNYSSSDWYYNAGFRPAHILLNHTYLAHVVKKKLGTHYLVSELYNNENWSEWKSLDTIHLLINHRSYLDQDSPIKEFNETNIWTYNRTYGIMVRSILRRANLYLPKDGVQIVDE